MMYDLQGLTFLYHVRLDTQERAQNVKIITNYYNTYATNYKNIFIEDDSKQKLPDVIEFTERDTYVYSKNTDAWNKCMSFNKGILLAKSEILAFHDLDAVIPMQQILSSINQLKADSNAGLVYPYNGLFLCVSPTIKAKFAQTLDINDIVKYWPDNLSINYDDGNILVGAHNSVGGCVLGRRDNVIKANGYNPNFRGWGYEDNEFPKRVHIMGFSVSRLTDPKAALWHLPHDGAGASPKVANPYHEENRQICSFVETAPKDKVREYTLSNWKLI